MKKKEFKVGEKINLGFLTLVVENGDGVNCNKCFFSRICNQKCENDVIEMVGGCVPSERNDKTDVIFVEVEE